MATITCLPTKISRHPAQPNFSIRDPVPAKTTSRRDQLQLIMNPETLLFGGHDTPSDDDELFPTFTFTIMYWIEAAASLAGSSGVKVGGRFSLGPRPIFT